MTRHLRPPGAFGSRGRCAIRIPDQNGLVLDSTRIAVERLRTAEEPAAAERVVPLSPHQVNHRVQVLAAALGLEGVSSHSGRHGLASELVRRGASTTAVQAAGGWRSAAMVARYASAVAVEDGAVEGGAVEGGAVAKFFGESGRITMGRRTGASRSAALIAWMKAPPSKG